MKAFFIALCLFLAGTLDSTLSAQWSRTTGNADANDPVQIKVLHNNIYVASNTTINGVQFATLSAFNISGVEQWTIRLDDPSVVTDFEIMTTDPSDSSMTTGVLMVGHTALAAQPNDNRTFIAEIRANGTQGGIRFFDHGGQRELFHSIVRTNDLENETTDYYISGNVNTSPEPSVTDRGVVWRLDAQGAVVARWDVRNTEAGTAKDSEVGRVIVNGSDDNLILGGAIQNGNSVGSLLTINRFTGAPVGGATLPGGYAVSDMLSAGDDIVIAGRIVGSSNCFISIRDANTYAEIWSQRLLGHVSLRGLSRDGNGNLYAVARVGGMANTNRLYRIFQDNNGQIVMEGRDFVYPNDSNLDFPDLAVLSDPTRLYYTDSRVKQATAGFGDRDIHLACALAFDQFVCTDTATVLANVPVIADSTATFTSANYDAPPVIDRKASIIDFNQMEANCSSTPPPVTCCNGISLQPPTPECQRSVLQFLQIPANCTVSFVDVSLSGGGSLQSVNGLFSGCSPQVSGLLNTGTFQFVPSCQPIQQLQTVVNLSGGLQIVTYAVHFEGSTEICTFADTLACCCPEVALETVAAGTISVEQTNSCQRPGTSVQVNLVNATFTAGSFSASGCEAAVAGYGGTSNLTVNVPCGTLGGFEFDYTATNTSQPVFVSVQSFVGNQSCSVDSLMIPVQPGGGGSDCDTICNAVIEVFRSESCPGENSEELHIQIENTGNTLSSICGVTVQASSITFEAAVELNLNLQMPLICTGCGPDFSLTVTPGDWSAGEVGQIEASYLPPYSGIVTVTVDFCGDACDPLVFEFNPDDVAFPGDHHSDLTIAKANVPSSPLHFVDFQLDKSTIPGNTPIAAISIGLINQPTSQLVAITNASPCDSTGTLGAQLSNALQDDAVALFQFREPMTLAKLNNEILRLAFVGDVPKLLEATFYDANNNVIHRSTPLFIAITDVDHEPIPNNGEQTQIKVYPNPASDLAYVTFDGGTSEQSIIRIVNHIGQVVLQVDSPQKGAQTVVAIETKGLDEGLYLVQYVSNSGKIAAQTKLIVLRK